MILLHACTGYRYHQYRNRGQQLRNDKRLFFGIKSFLGIHRKAGGSSSYEGIR
jgi:hypothetical protein